MVVLYAAELSDELYAAAAVNGSVAGPHVSLAKHVCGSYVAKIDGEQS